MQKFRKLKADEIECRISTCNSNGIMLLLYKDARCDQNILDETVGSMNWQRHHSRDNANCTVSIWDAEKRQWIEKEDTGTESYTEKEKGIASDSFKRACFNWGIGRELYTAPRMYVGKGNLKTLEEKNGRWTCLDRFCVEEIQYLENKIVYVKITNTYNNKKMEFGTPADLKKSQEKTGEHCIPMDKIQALIKRCAEDRVTQSIVKKACGVSSLKDITEKQYLYIHQHWEEIKAGNYKSESEK